MVCLVSCTSSTMPLDSDREMLGGINGSLTVMLNISSNQIESIDSKGKSISLAVHALTAFSIECVQASIDEGFETWKTGQFPKGTTDASGNLLDNCDNFKALQIVPLPEPNGLDQNQERNGNPIQIWTTVKDYSQQNAFELSNKVPPSEKTYELPGDVAKRVAGNAKYSHSENGYWFARRANLENFCESDFQWGSPGIQFGLLGLSLILMEYLVDSAD